MSDKPLTERQLDVLQELRACERRGDGWARPMDVGGSTRSHHSETLCQLIRRGFAERRDRRKPWQTRGSFVYRITAAGTAHLESL